MKDGLCAGSVVFVLFAGIACGLGGAKIAGAQDAPRYELSAGYAFLRDEDVNIPVGWNTSFAVNYTDSLGAIADIGGHYKTLEGVDVSLHTFLVGSRYSFRGERLTPYVDVLIGVERASASVAGVSDSASDFAAQFGVGIGYKVSDRVSLRTGFDFRNVSTEGGSTQQYRALAGVSFAFGERGGGSSSEPRSGESSEPRAQERSRQDSYGTEAPRYELSAGYAFLRDQDLETNFPAGWYTSFALNLTSSLGVVADLGGHYKTVEGVRLDLHAFLAGARYSFRGERLTPYVEALVGAARATTSVGGVSESGSDLAAQVGVGIAYKVSDRVSLRVGGDFRNIFTEGTSLQEFRVLGGLSFGFGGSREAGDSTERYEPLPPQAPPTVAPAPAAPPTAQPARPAPQPQAPPTRLPAPAPAPAPPPSAAPAPALGKARELLSAGNYSQAADAFRADLPVHAPNMFTIPVGVYCDASNLAQLVRSADARELVLVRLMLRGQTCYGLYWGLFRSGTEAHAALAQLPPTLRAPGQAPISVSRVLARAR